MAGRHAPRRTQFVQITLRVIAVLALLVAVFVLCIAAVLALVYFALRLF